MTGWAPRTPAARERLARLVVALAILAGLGLAIGLQCTDGMAMPAMPAMSVAPGMTSMACDAPAGMANPPAAACTASGAVADQDVPGSHGLGGLLATCLAFILAVAAAVVALRPQQARNVVRLPLSPRVVIRTVRPRAPSLAELCLLRT